MHVIVHRFTFCCFYYIYTTSYLLWIFLCDRQFCFDIDFYYVQFYRTKDAETLTYTFAYWQDNKNKIKKNKILCIWKKWKEARKNSATSLFVNQPTNQQQQTAFTFIFFSQSQRHSHKCSLLFGLPKAIYQR